MTDFTRLADTALADYPDALRQALQPSLPVLTETLGEAFAGHDELAGQLLRLCALSHFCLRTCLRQPAVVAELMASGDLHQRLTASGQRQRIDALVGAEPDEAQMLRALRLARAREFLRIAWRDIIGQVPLEETLAALSGFAEAAIDAARAFSEATLAARFGQPRGADGRPMHLVVLGMGKLGAGELNFSSDIDLIFAFAEPGETPGERRSLSHEEFFNRVGRQLIRLLAEVTGDGQVFRVDMRLRPFGDAGPLSMSRPALLAYLEAHGRDWERYAWIKARTVAGDIATGEALLADAAAFIYRRYIDFGALESLREMKRMITEEALRRGMTTDIKRGSGGIREIEFTGQALQIIRGGREPALRARPIRDILAVIADLGLLPAADCHELDAAYVFLRRVENRLQQLDDRQTHALPTDAADRSRIALGMGYAGWAALDTELDAHRVRVAQHFRDLLGGDAAPGPRASLDGLWQLGDAHAAVTERLQAAGIAGAEALGEAVAALHRAPHMQRLSTTGFARMARLLPALIEEVSRQEEPLLAFERVGRLLDAVATRSVYLALLAEHGPALQQLVRLCAASPFIADQLVRQPMLLDELLNPASLYAPPARPALEAALHELLARHPQGDLEGAMEALREFRHAQALRVAAADIVGELPVAEVSNHLSDIAEVCVAGALALARDHLAARHGRPCCRVDDTAREAGFAVIAYGKLGGLELGYGSDLDLVFVHDSAGEAQFTDGERSIDNSVFFTRLGQRFIHLLQTRTHADRVYEIDARLRPSGESGLLVVSLQAFRDYQFEKAWTWEHQALVRARAVAGPAPVREAFEAIRREVLATPRDPDKLAGDIVDMRTRMRRELGSRDPARFDLKQDSGGITDIEFMVQYAVLRWAPQHPGLLSVTDNLRLLESLASTGLLPAADCSSLHDAYFAYRAVVHRQALQERAAEVEAEAFRQHRDNVLRVWRNLFAQYEDSGEQQ